jgi:hypothetical protein
LQFREDPGVLWFGSVSLCPLPPFSHGLLLCHLHIYSFSISCRNTRAIALPRHSRMTPSQNLSLHLAKSLFHTSSPHSQVTMVTCPPPSSHWPLPSAYMSFWHIIQPYKNNKIGQVQWLAPVILTTEDCSLRPVLEKS